MHMSDWEHLYSRVLFSLAKNLRSATIQSSLTTQPRLQLLPAGTSKANEAAHAPANDVRCVTQIRKLSQQNQSTPHFSFSGFYGIRTPRRASEGGLAPLSGCYSGCRRSYRRLYALWLQELQRSLPETPWPLLSIDHFGMKEAAGSPTLSQRVYFGEGADLVHLVGKRYNQGKIASVDAESCHFFHPRTMTLTAGGGWCHPMSS